MSDMRAATLGAPGEAFEVMSLPMPAPGPSEIRIKVSFAGVSEADFLSRTGRDALYRVDFPVVLGQEVVGVVDAVGADVTGIVPGARVMACVPGGGYAEFVVVDESRAAPLSMDVDLAQAVAYGNELWSAYCLFHELAPIVAGSKVLIHSADRGVGSFLVQLSKASGCTVIALANDEVGEEYCRVLGADHVVREVGDQEFTSEVQSVVGEDGVDVIFNDRAGGTLGEDLKVLKFRGTWIIYRAALGLDQLGSVDVQMLTVKNPSIIPAIPQAFIGHNEFRNALRFQASAAESGMFRRTVHRFALEDAGRAHAELERGRLMGKIVLAVGSS